MPKYTETKVMLPIINQRIKPGTFLLSTFFGGQPKTHKAEIMEIDYKVGKRKMAPFVSPRVGGKVMEREGFETREIKVPKVAPERLTTIDDVSSTGMGENEYSTKSMKQRQQEMLVEDLSELDDMIVRREEWEVRMCVLEKHVPIKGKGVDKDVKFDDDDTLVLSGTNLFSDAESDPIATFKAEQRKITQATGKRPRIIVFDSDAGDAFLKNVKVNEAFDKRRIMRGELKPTIKDENVTFLGKITELALELYVYDEWFIDDDDVEKPILPSGTAIIGSKGLGKMHYGAVKQMEKGKFVSFESKRVPKYIVDEDNEITKLRLSSRPLPVPENTKSWRVLKVL